MNKSDKKKKKHGGKVAAGVCVCIIALLLVGLFLDLGGFGSQLGLPTFGQTEITQPEALSAEEAFPAEEDDPAEDSSLGDLWAPIDEAPEPISLLIRVSGDTIFHGDDEITVADLQALLLEHNEPGLVWELRDEQAILAVYEEVKVLLMEQGATFTETSG